MTQNTIIIGAGISGLSAAYYLEKAGEKGSITILEAAKHPGGKVATTHEDGFIVEHAPDSFITTKPFMLDLVSDLGLSKDIIAPANSKFFILKDGKLMDVPKGLNFMVATDEDAFMQSEMFTEAGKHRALEEVNIPAKKFDADEDESFGDFVERRFGKEMLENYAEPLFAGIYSTPSYELSMKAAFPMFRNMEQKFGSITQAINAIPVPEAAPKNKNENLQRSPFVSLKHGMQSIIDALLQKLYKTKILTEAKVLSIHKNGDGYKVITDTHIYDAGRVIITLPAAAAATLFATLDSKIQNILESFPSNSSRILTLAFNKKDCELPDATGYVVAKGSDTLLSACTWSSKKWDYRAPDAYHLIRCFFSKTELLKLSKDELIMIANQELSKLVPVHGTPVKSWLSNYPNLLPQYKVGHLEKLKQLNMLLEALPEIQLIGAYYDGIGMPDCVKQAQAL